MFRFAASSGNPLASLLSARFRRYFGSARLPQISTGTLYFAVGTLPIAVIPLPLPEGRWRYIMIPRPGNAISVLARPPSSLSSRPELVRIRLRSVRGTVLSAARANLYL